MPTSVPTRVVPTATFTPTPVPGTEIIVGQPARVAAAQGLNVRKGPSVEGERMGRYAPGTLLSILEGPVDVDGYRWWRVGNNELSGWVAEGDDTQVWLSPKIGSTQPVDRPVQLGDEVIVTVESTGFLKLRVKPGLDSLIDHRVQQDTQLSVVEGPVDVNGYRWWLVTDGGGVSGWAAEASRSERWLTPLE
ncbi:MAG: SH3 domain-containing protein [Chloroflexota bacterium]|nr:SH3 domain-containing protein [Chloroflexota bacterium]